MMDRPEKCLFIVVRHPDAPIQTWENIWSTDRTTLDKITTTPTVRAQCLNADVIFVHRCGLSQKGKPHSPPRLCCSVRVRNVKGSDTEPVIEFDLVDILDLPVPKRLYYPANSYYEKCPMSAEV